MLDGVSTPSTGVDALNGRADGNAVQPLPRAPPSVIHCAPPPHRGVGASWRQRCRRSRTRRRIGRRG